MTRLVATVVGEAGTVCYSGEGTGGGLDFTISYFDGRCGVGEVVWHEDAKIQEMRQVLAREEQDGPIALPAGLGSWIVHLARGARIKDLAEPVRQFILGLDGAAIDDISLFAHDASPEHEAQMSSLGLTGIRQFSGIEPAAAYLMVPDCTGGAVPDADSIVEWIEEVLGHDAYLDVTKKLLEDDADERHAFVVAGSRTPLGPFLRLANGSDMCPARGPRVPSGITDIWCTSTFGVAPALHWSGSKGWQEVPRQPVSTPSLWESRPSSS